MRWADRLPGLRVVDASQRRGRRTGPQPRHARRRRPTRCCSATPTTRRPRVGRRRWSPRSAATRSWAVRARSRIPTAASSRPPSKLRPDPRARAVPDRRRTSGCGATCSTEVGGFETDHPEAQAEDAEFCLRAWELGHVAGFAPGALMTKARRPDLRSTYRQWKGYGIGTMFNACRFRDRGTLRAARAAARSGSSAGWSCTCPRCAPATAGMRWVRWAAAKVGWVDGLPALPPARRWPPARPAPGHLSHPLRRVLIMEKGHHPSTVEPAALRPRHRDRHRGRRPRPARSGRVLAVGRVRSPSVTPVRPRRRGRAAPPARPPPGRAAARGDRHLERRPVRPALPGHPGRARPGRARPPPLGRPRPAATTATSLPGPRRHLPGLLARPRPPRRLPRLPGRRRARRCASAARSRPWPGWPAWPRSRSTPPACTTSPPAEMAAYVGSDARCTAELARRRWATARLAVDRSRVGSRAGREPRPYDDRREPAPAQADLDVELRRRPP